MPLMPVSGDCRIQFEAIDPSTGAAVSGVTISLAVIYATDVAAGQETLDGAGPFMLVPGPGSIG
jgi:hypothetical protein